MGFRMARTTRGICAVLLDHGGTLVTDRPGNPDDIFVDLLKEERIPVHRSALQGVSEYFQMYWLDNYSNLPRGARWTTEIRTRCNMAALEHYRVECDRETVARRISEGFEEAAHPSLFPDVLPTLEVLRTMGLKIGVVSQHLMTSEQLREDLDRRGVGRYFEMVLTSESAGFDKPDPALYLEAASRLGLPVAEICHAGNSLVNDALSAQYAGLHGILVDREGTEPKVEGLPVVRSLVELPTLI